MRLWLRLQQEKLCGSRIPLKKGYIVSSYRPYVQVYTVQDAAVNMDFLG
jgi:hypothetical protein